MTGPSFGVMVFQTLLSLLLHLSLSDSQQLVVFSSFISILR